MKAPHNGYFLSLHKWTITKNKAKSKMKKPSKCRCQLNSSFQQSGGLAYLSATHEASFVGEGSETCYEPPDEAEGYQVAGDTVLQRECSVATSRSSYFNKARPCHMSLNHLQPWRPHSLKWGWYVQGLVSASELGVLVPSPWKQSCFWRTKVTSKVACHDLFSVVESQTLHMLWR